MVIAYLLFFLTFEAFSQTKGQIKVLPDPTSIEDFAHEFKGCPENSECDQVMGLQMQRWKELVEKLEEGEVSASKKAQYLELFRAKYGIPVEFYTTKKSQQGFRPLFFNSPCKQHNPKQEDLKILKGIAFIKSLSPEKALVWRDQAQIEVPLGEVLIPQPVWVHYPKEVAKYLLPLGDQPLFIKNKELYVLKEEDNLFYILKVGPKGEWKVEDVDFSRLSKWQEKKENVACPVDKGLQRHDAFTVEFCKTVWDEDLGKTVVIRMAEGCTT